MLWAVAVLTGASVALAAVGVVRDVRDVRRFRAVRAQATDLAVRAVDRLAVGDVDGATELARRSREKQSKALDLMETW